MAVFGVLYLFFNVIQRAFFQPADLRLTDADFRADFNLRHSLEKAEVENPLFPVVQIAGWPP